MPVLPPGKNRNLTEDDMAILCCIGIGIDDDNDSAPEDVLTIARAGTTRW